MKEQYLKEGERLDDLGCGGLFLIQRPHAYCFSSDAVLLAGLAKAQGVVCDLGTGSGVIPLLLAAKQPCKQIFGIEIDPEMVDMARRSVALNGLCGRIEIICADVREDEKMPKAASVDTVVCNPPYFKAKSGATSVSDEKAAARHELNGTLKEWIHAAERILKFGGRFFMVLKCARMAEALALLESVGLTPKKLTLIRPKPSKTFDTFVVECKKGAADGLVIKEFVLFDEDGSLSETAKIMYNRV